MQGQPALSQESGLGRFRFLVYGFVVWWMFAGFFLLFQVVKGLLFRFAKV